jgi:hypothetical protein
LEEELGRWEAELAQKQATLANERLWYLGFSNEAQARRQQKRTSTDDEKVQLDLRIEACESEMKTLEAHSFVLEQRIYELRHVMIPNRNRTLSSMRAKSRPPYW